MTGTASDALRILIAHRDRLDRAIAALQSEAPRRGRPPGSGKASKAKAKIKVKKTRTFSAEARKRQSQKMKAYWAKRRKAAK